MAIVQFINRNGTLIYSIDEYIESLDSLEHLYSDAKAINAIILYICVKHIKQKIL